MSRNKGRAADQIAAFTVVIRADEVRCRKALAPAGRPMADRRRKNPRRKPDHLAEY
ncbi:MAG: hypothetical protein RDU24_15100 [Humidesulfovibrio sp.]|uniref:hypothetical protein n=1 Tax=Humidesulfovibrio sp. TaxID=2910988 RepID=UPI0027FC5150|nr:hypothetical protein [Humidesulfovibrio sp.]MDQ7836705.1 hypothetical protein [Humidesulfovibrio sp.]